MVARCDMPKPEHGQMGCKTLLPSSLPGLLRTAFISCVWSLLAVFLGAGCATSLLMPTPNLYSHTSDNPFADVPPVFRTNTADILYLTDRAWIAKPTASERYGSMRSVSLSFGMTTVRIGKEMSWDDLVAASRSTKRHARVSISTLATREIGKFPPVPTSEIEQGGQWVESPESVTVRQAAEVSFKALVAERLALTPKKEVYVFIHGTGSDFPSAAYVMAELWHFMGRCGVPVVYSWPSSGSGDSLGGYDYNRESSEFTVYHLKQFLRLVAACPGVEKVHIIAHSRGTDTALAALRELNIEIRASGGDTRKALKLGCFVLAAADMDLEVSTQRVSAERLMRVPEQMVLYVSPNDIRLRLASYFFGSRDRLGQSHVADRTPRRAELLKNMPDIQFIDATVAGSLRGSHFYFYSHPAVSSDLILLLRDNRGPGAEKGRPLSAEAGGFWLIDQDYPVLRQKGGL